MGGHGHHHGPPPDPYKVPDASQYANISHPELDAFQQKLAKHGLKDPWIRNYNWRFEKRYGTTTSRTISYLTRGMGLGVGLFIATIAIEKALGIDWHAYHHAHEEGHGEAHH